MSSVAPEIKYFMPEDSERIESEEHVILSAVWDEDRPGGILTPEYTSASVFTIDFEREDPRYWMVRNLGQMCLAARRARMENATSWHGQKVASTFMSYDLEKSQMAFLSLGNLKPEESHFTNCSEINLLLAVREFLGHANIGAIALAGPNNNQIRTPEGGVVSAIAPDVMPSKTLLPCYRCDSALSHASEVDDRTLVVSVAKDVDVMQLQTFKEYHRRQGQFALTNTFEDAQAFKFISDPTYWQENADIYSMLRDRRGLSSSDIGDSPKDVLRKSKLLSEVLYTSSSFYRES